MVAWQMPQDPKVSRFLVVYSVLTTLFCFYFIHLSKFDSRTCSPAVENTPITDLAAELTPAETVTVTATQIIEATPTASPQPGYVHNPLTALKPGEFPRRIWQTAKTSAAGLGEDERRSIQTWVTQSQQHRYEVITKHSAETYVQ